MFIPSAPYAFQPKFAATAASVALGVSSEIELSAPSSGSGAMDVVRARGLGLLAKEKLRDRTEAGAASGQPIVIGWVRERVRCREPAHDPGGVVGWL